MLLRAAHLSSPFVGISVPPDFSHPAEVDSSAVTPNFLLNSWNDLLGVLNHATQGLFEPQGMSVLFSKSVSSGARGNSGAGGAAVLEPSASRTPAPDGPSERPRRHYKLTRKLGQGGFGAVYAGVEYNPVARSNSGVAVKISRPPTHDEDGEKIPENIRQEILKRTHEEARLLLEMRGKDARFVAPIDVMLDNESVTIVTCLVEGLDLSQMRTEVFGKEISPKAVLKIISETLGALNALHKNGIVHRDVKPSNIMVNTEGQVLLIDFGIAHQSALPGGVEVERLAKTTSLDLGSNGYLPPEGMNSGSKRDIYALGITAMRLLGFLNAPAPLVSRSDFALYFDQRILPRFPEHRDALEVLRDLILAMTDGEKARLTASQIEDIIEDWESHMPGSGLGKFKEKIQIAYDAKMSCAETLAEPLILYPEVSGSSTQDVSLPTPVAVADTASLSRSAAQSQPVRESSSGSITRSRIVAGGTVALGAMLSFGAALAIGAGAWFFRDQLLSGMDSFLAEASEEVAPIAASVGTQSENSGQQQSGDSKAEPVEVAEENPPAEQIQKDLTAAQSEVIAKPETTVANSAPAPKITASVPASKRAVSTDAGKIPYDVKYGDFESDAFTIKIDNRRIGKTNPLMVAPGTHTIDIYEDGVKIKTIGLLFKADAKSVNIGGLPYQDLQ